MELLILDKNFDSSETLDIFESLIWTDRYYECGDFELYMPANEKVLTMLPQGYYLYLRDSEHVMVVEDTEIETDTEEGAHLKITGRSLESILERRIIWNRTVLSGSFQQGIKKLLDENVISPSDASRKISNFVFKESSDERITSLSVDAQYFGENLYDAISDLCKSENIGFKIILDGTNFVFSLYMGEDRSYNQEVNPYVIFSPGFDNLMNSNYIESDKTLKNVTLVAGEGEGSERKTVSVFSGEEIQNGLDRRELFTDASGVSTMVDGQTISDQEYTSQLSQKGYEELAKNKTTISFEGEVDPSGTYEYDKDYFLGDVIQIANEFGCQARSQITEFIRSQSDTGIECYPTFSSYEDIFTNPAYSLMCLTRKAGSYIFINDRSYTKTNDKPVIFIPAYMPNTPQLWRYWIVLGRTENSVIGSENTPQYVVSRTMTINNRTVYLRAIENGAYEGMPFSVKTENFQKDNFGDAYPIEPGNENNFYLKLAERMLPV